MFTQQFAISFAIICCIWSAASSTVRGQTPPANPDKLRVLIVDGRNPYHDWRVTSPLMKRILEDSGRFQVEIVTVPVPEQYQSMATEPPPVQERDFHPKFSKYDVVVGNYIGSRWPAQVEQKFLDFVAGGHGYVSVHSADNAFPDWPQYNRMTGVGGWYGRDERWGPHVYVDDSGKVVRDTSPGPAGHHGAQHEFQVQIRDPDHPITRGLPPVWMHTQDELYDTLRGPAENMHILATAYSDPEFSGTGKNEPMLMTLPYGKGRIFHTTLGHADYSMKCLGFVTTLLRGTEWAATGKVTLGVPENFPTAEKSQAWHE